MQNEKRKIRRKEDGAVEISLSAALYPREPLFAACCVFVDDFYVWLDLSANGKRYKVSLMPKENTATVPLPFPPHKGEGRGTVSPPFVEGDSDGKDSRRQIAGKFQNELLSMMLRYTVAARNQNIRECIVRKALLFSQPRKEQKRLVRELAKAEGKGERDG